MPGGNFFVASRSRSLTAGSSPPPTTTPPTSPPPPPSTSANVLTRVGTNLQWGGQTTKLWGVCNIPMGVLTFDGPPTWTQAKQDRALGQITVIKNYGMNYIRGCFAPGMYRYWSDPARNRFWGFVDAYVDRCASEGIFFELNWWTVSTPDGQRADDSFFAPEYAPGYDSSKALCRQFWTEAANRYKTRGHVIFSFWDEPIKAVASDTWTQLQPFVQELVTLVRNQGAPNLLSIPGNHYSRDFTTILTTHQLTDPTDNWAIRCHEFEALEPQNYQFLAASGGVLVDTVRPLIIGGTGYEPVTKTAPSRAEYITWLNTHVYPKAKAIAWWVGDKWATPNLWATGFPMDEPVTLTNYGAYVIANPINPRLPASGGVVSPPSPPTSPPPPTTTPTTGILDPVPLTSANVWVDTVNGDDSRSGNSAANAVRTWTRVQQLMAAGRTLAIAGGSVFNQETVINNWAGCTIGYYGSGPRPIFKSTQIFTSGWEFVRNISGVNGGAVYRIPLGALPQSTAYAAARVTHATIVIVNDTQHLSWYARNGQGEIGGNGRRDMFWHTSSSGYLYFSCVGTVTKVEVPYGDPFRIGNSTGFTVRDIMFGPARGHAFIAEGNQDNRNVLRCHAKYFGISGFYMQLRNGAATDGENVTYCLAEDGHAEGIVSGCGGGQNAGVRNLNISNNVIRRVNKGPPFIFAGTSSQDFYAAAIKLFTELGTSFPSSGYVQDNLIEDIGDLGTPYYYAPGGYAYNGVNGYESNQGQGIWPDTVNGAIVVRRNTIRRTWAAGVFVENCPNRPHVVEYNLMEDVGQQPCGWTGGVCIGRNSSSTIVRHNTILRPKNGGFTLQGTPNNQKVSNLDIRDNIVVCQGSDPFVVERSGNGNANTNWRNNLWYNPNSPRWGFLGGTDGASNSTFWNTPTFYTTLQAWSSARGGLVTNNLTSNPNLNSSNVPQSGSPAINAATDGTDIGKEQT